MLGNTVACVDDDDLLVGDVELARFHPESERNDEEFVGRGVLVVSECP